MPTMMIALLASAYLLIGFGVAYLRLSRPDEATRAIVEGQNYLMVFAYWLLWPLTLVGMGIYLLTDPPKHHS